MQNLERLKQIIICPKCKTSIKNKEIKCSKCSKIYLSKNKLYFLKINTTFKVSDWFDKIKSMYEIILLITHNPITQDWADKIITIEKNNDISTLHIE